MEHASRFLDVLPPAAAELLRGRAAELEQLLAELCDRAEAEHPALPPDRLTLIAALARRVPDGTDRFDGLAKLRVADLFLSGSAAAGNAAAVATVEALLYAEVRGAGLALRAPDTLVDEARQRLRVHLLVGSASRGPALADYAGHGHLRGFLRISATRECLRLLRAGRREVGLADDQLMDGALDPELAHLKATYRLPFTRAFLRAFDELTPRERTLLRHHTIDRLTIDRIGALYGAHRATAARWLERARTKLAERTEEHLAEDLGLDVSEISSVIRLVRSQLDVSLEELLNADAQR